MSGGPRSFWTTREGVVLIVVGLVVAGAAIWGIGSLLQDAMKPGPKQPPVKTKPDRPRQEPQPKLPNPDANP